MVAPSCSLLHVPVDLAQENELDARGKGLAGLRAQKLEEVATLSARAG